MGCFYLQKNSLYLMESKEDEDNYPILRATKGRPPLTLTIEERTCWIIKDPDVPMGVGPSIRIAMKLAVEGRGEGTSSGRWFRDVEGFNQISPNCSKVERRAILLKLYGYGYLC